MDWLSGEAGPAPRANFGTATSKAEEPLGVAYKQPILFTLLVPGAQPVMLHIERQT